ncbi:hypothetical protein KKG22_03385 [Patescibacteria group bacterium]|nr:hypothetical protein [Patescibacteria group bacterium]MBU1721192.1 hypothetical protein [Patescibacteria group bacterium]MBU1901100.1 hypothetical protein [Patescibacteria group bacterium]
MMQDAILSMPKQFEYTPQIEQGKQQTYTHYILLGMGGSHLAADILAELNPILSLRIYSDYGLPHISDEKNTLIIASSYSGNTEEVLEGAQLALKQGIPLAVISVGGALIDLAKKYNLPYIQMPDTGIQPRSALGFSLRALMKLLGEETLLKESNKLAHMNPQALEEQGKKIATSWTGKTPVIYTSQKNKSIAYNWKIKMNETGKIPAVYNVFPEMNHNEMNGFDVSPDHKELIEHFTICMIEDEHDHPKVQKRMHIAKKLYEDRGIPVMTLKLEGATHIEKIFTSLTLADWVAVHSAAQYGHEAEQVPMIEEFKRLIG